MGITFAQIQCDVAQLARNIKLNENYEKHTTYTNNNYYKDKLQLKVRTNTLVNKLDKTRQKLTENETY